MANLFYYKFIRHICLQNLVLLFVIYPPLVYLFICLVASIAPYTYRPMSLEDYTYTCFFKVTFPISTLTVTNYIVYSKYDFTKFQVWIISVPKPACRISSNLLILIYLFRRTQSLVFIFFLGSRLYSSLDLFCQWCTRKIYWCST